MIGRVECPNCGHWVDPRGLSRHQAGKACRAAVTERAMRKRGWKRCGAVRALIKRVGGQIEMALAFVPDGKADNGRPRRRCRTVAWSPAHLVDAAQYAESADQLSELLSAVDARSACEEFAALGTLSGSRRRGRR